MVRPTHVSGVHPVGYRELQFGWSGERLPEELRTTSADLLAQGLSENPGYEACGLPRLEFTADGAGLLHFTLYVGIAPKHTSSEPLDPRNLNDAPLPSAADPGPSDGILPLGSREQKF